MVAWVSVVLGRAAWLARAGSVHVCVCVCVCKWGGGVVGGHWSVFEFEVQNFVK